MNADTLAIANQLKADGIDSDVAEAITRAIYNHTETRVETLVTTADLSIALKDLEVKLIKWMIGVNLAAVALIVTLIKFT